MNRSAVVAALSTALFTFGAPVSVAAPSSAVQPLSESQVNRELESFNPEKIEDRDGDTDRGREIYQNLQESDSPWVDVEKLSDSDANSLLAYVNSIPENAGTLRYPGENSDFIMKLNEKIACVRAIGASNCRKAADLAEKAQRDAEFRFAGRMHNGGPGDAFRHCWWSASMTTDISERAAKIVGDNHEKYATTNSPGDREMDLFNNAQGRWAAVASNYRWQDAVELCDQWANNNILRVNNP